MTAVTLYHNARCSKSRAALALLEARGITPDVVEYLKDAPSRDELVALARLLDVRPHAFARTGEAVYRELGLSDASSDDEMFDAMAAHPILIERPIAVADGKRAVVGRPPERVLEIL
jgi:arsenate reductase